ncbi:haloacid dehalogenase-like hydrolase [Fragilaria crotonensis]|nr:haloacid dehalogenase-like hydrolase [Fragilaria crotonensis]
MDLCFQVPRQCESIFLRRCNLEDATYVAVVAPTKIVDIMSIPGMGEKLADIIWAPFNYFFMFYFSYPHAIPGTVTSFCKVESDGTTRSFYHRMRRYVYNAEAVGFIPGSMNVGTTIGDFLSQTQGLTSDEVARRGGLAGPNVIKIQEPTIHGSIMKEFSKGFYIYQTFMVWSYGPFWYYYMMIVHTIVRVTSGIVVGVFQFMSDSVLHKLSLVEGNIEVLRDGEFFEIAVTDVVPGDVVVIKSGNAPCDMVVVKAHHILVDESALTGESIPILKTALDPTMSGVTYNPTLHKSNTISAGTVVIEVGEGQHDLGLVLKTGSFTTKGELLSDVLSYERHKFKFDDEVKIVLFILLLEAIVLFALVFYFLQDQWVFAWFYGLYVVITVLPPLLPSVFVVSVGISANRLQAKRISCTNPEGILVAGKVDAAFFDKTGTLTKNGMDFLSLDSGVDSADKASVESAESWIKLGMALCHTLALTSTGELVGNQVDSVSFETSKAIMKQESGELPKISYLGEWFTVLKRKSGGHPCAFQPIHIAGFVRRYAPDVIEVWYYQIAIAYKEFDLASGSLADVRRDDVEKSLMYAGFVKFQNAMKEDTPAVLQELKEGNVLLAMITGDSVLTGICIAKESGMIGENRKVVIGSKASHDEIEWTDEESGEIVKQPMCDALDSPTSDVDLALSGAAWSLLRSNDPKYASAIAKHVRVFGRCNPTDKVSVVSTFVENRYITLMCGDGQNDCGALKSAHVGVALSTSEASIVAPFTSLDKVISSVPEVLREGRCALASAFAAYKYYINFGQIESILQTISAYLAISLAEWCWVFFDGIWSITLAFSLPLSKAASRLSRIRPTASLLGSHTLYSACGLVVWNFLFLVIALLALFSQDWFQCRKWNSDDVSKILSIGDNYESSVVFIVGGYQMTATAIALNFGYTFRQSWWRNYVFVFFAVLWTVFVFVVTIVPSGFSCLWRVNCDNENAVRGVTETEPVAINNPWNTTVMPVAFRWILVGIMAANVLTLVIWEYFFVNGLLHRGHCGTIDKGEAKLDSTTKSSHKNEVDSITD